MKTCLIVDDSRVVRKVMRRIVEELGFACEEAENGKEALLLCKKSAFDAIVLDWRMPEMDGMAFMEKFRQGDTGKAARIIFCTTETGADNIEKALAAGADEYIMKPFDAQIVRDKFAVCGLL